MQECIISVLEGIISVRKECKISARACARNILCSQLFSQITEAHESICWNHHSVALGHGIFYCNIFHIKKCLKHSFRHSNES